MQYTKEVAEVMIGIAQAAVEEIEFDVANHDEIRDLILNRLSEKFRIDTSDGIEVTGDLDQDGAVYDEFQTMYKEVHRDVVHMAHRLIYGSTIERAIEGVL